MEKATYDGEDATDQYDEYTFSLQDDNSARLKAVYVWGNFTYQYETDGTWEFMNDKKQISLDFEDDEADRIYIIQRLTTDEFWIRKKGEDIELQLKPV